MVLSSITSLLERKISLFVAVVYSLSVCLVVYHFGKETAPGLHREHDLPMDVSLRDLQIDS